MIKLRLPFWVQVVLAAQVREGSRLSEGNVRIDNSEGEGRRWWLLSVGSVVWEFIGTEFCVCQVQFKDSSKCGILVRQLL